MIKVAVTGACGRMGSKVIKAILKQEDMMLVAAIGTPNTHYEGMDICELMGMEKIEVPINGAQDLYKVLKEKQPDILVDFTVAYAAVDTIKISAACGVNVVVGTTGFSDDQMEEIKKFIEEKNIKAVIAPNMTIGINAFFKAIEKLATILNDYDIEIIESHHKNKVDAPSGTALRTNEIIADVRGTKDLETILQDRHGIMGTRTSDEIEMHAVRGGDIVGDHKVLFAGYGERIEIIHRSHNRKAFVAGVIKPIRYVLEASEGKISDMADVLGIK